MAVYYLTLAEVLEMHRQLIEEFGGSHGLRDPGTLEAAVFRPQVGYYNNLTEEAAALMESLVNNHPFIDGNKRIAFAVADTFLRVNGYFLEVDTASAYKFIVVSMKKGEFRFGLIRDWVASRVRPLSEDPQES